MNRWLDLAHKLSFDSCHNRQKMGAVIVRGGAVLSLAANHRRWGGHAEVRSLAAAGDVAGATCYVMRYNRRISKPCPNCRELLILRGVKKAVYINHLGEVEEERYG